MIFLLSWKNIWRNKARSWVVLIAVALGMFGGLYATAFMTGVTEQRLRDAIDNETANIQVHHPNFLLNKELTDTLNRSSYLFTALDTCKKVIAYSPRLRIIAMAATANSNAGINIYAINPANEKQVTGIYKHITDSMGTYFAEDRKNSIVIGYKLAQKLKIKLKSKIIVTFQNLDGNMVTTAYKVTGIYKTTNTDFDQKNVFVNFNEISRLLEFKSDCYHEIAIKLADDSYSPLIKKGLQHINPYMKVETWRELSPDLAMLFDSKSYMLYIVLVIILSALCFGIINTMLMAVLERIPEIGMLMAIGMNKIKLFKMIMTETILLLFSGSLIGISIAFITIQYQSVHGVNLSQLASGLEDIGMAAVVYPSMSWYYYFITSALVIFTGILASILPALRATGLKPAEAIRKL